MIRTGETSALVELVFETENPHVLELLKRWISRRRRVR